MIDSWTVRNIKYMTIKASGILLLAFLQGRHESSLKWTWLTDSGEIIQTGKVYHIVIRMILYFGESAAFYAECGVNEGTFKHSPESD